MNPTPTYQSAVDAFHNAPPAKAYECALALCQEQPGHYEAEQMAGIAALTSGHQDWALKHLKKAIDLTRDPHSLAVSWTCVGRAYLDQRLADRAEAAFSRALALIPDFPAALIGLAEALNFLGQFGRAAELAERSIEKGFPNARSYAALGVARMRQKSFDEATRHFKKALELDPNSGSARYGLGVIERINGNFANAAELFRSSGQSDSDIPDFEQLASLKKFTDENDPDLLVMKQMITDPAATELQKEGLAYALAKAYDDINKPDEASKYLVQANKYGKLREFRNYDPQASEKRAAHITETFTADFIERYSIQSFTHIRPIFIISLPRSGSTLTEQMLGMHSRITAGGEMSKLSKVATALSVQWGNDPSYPDMDVEAAKRDLEKAARAYSDETAKLHLIHPYFTDKSLENFYFLGLIRMMYPNARIVHVRRHPLASTLGIFRQRFTQAIPYSSDLGEIARHHKLYTRLMSHWAKQIPGLSLDVFYESLVHNPEQELRSMFSHLGLDYEPDALRYYELKRPVDTASVVQVRQPLQTAGIERHKRYTELLRPAAETLSEEIADYETQLKTRMDQLKG